MQIGLILSLGDKRSGVRESIGSEADRTPDGVKKADNCEAKFTTNKIIYNANTRDQDEIN